jgi:AraC-like DNA-binding protein
MKYAESPCRSPLSRWIRCFWVLSGDAATGARPPETVFPDGCAEIVVNLADPFLHHAGGAPVAQPTAMVVGPSTRPMRIAPSGAVDVVGIRFEPHASPVALGVSADEITDRALPLEAVAQLRSEVWMERLAETASWRLRVHILERALQHVVDERRSDALVEGASRIIERSGGRVSIECLSRHLGVLPRRLERRFRAQVGIAPKKLCRITRFQRFLGELREADAGLAGAAVRCGYTDQAHLTRDFRDFAGSTPAAFREGDEVLPRLFAGLAASF